MYAQAAVSSKGKEGTVYAAVIGFLLLWLAGISIASASGLLATQGLNSPPVIAVGMLAVVLIAYFRWARLREWLGLVGVRKLTALHILRATATPLFLWYGAHGLLPKVFADRAGWGDLIAAGAALLAVTVWRRPAGYWLAQVIGILDFFAAFATAIPLGKEMSGAMQAIVSLPMVLIPCFLVVLFFAIHVFVMHQLLRGRDAHEPQL